MHQSVDLFAGIGGIRLGFEQVFKNDIKTIFVSEWDKKAVETYRANFNDKIEIVGDIREVCEEAIPNHDILLVGFPCQAFSLAGHKRGFEDTKGTLFFDVARIMKYHKPRVVFCENVKNLIYHDKGRTFQVIKSTLEDLGYKIFWRVLNSKDFGVPQQRERIYIVAFRNDMNMSGFNFPLGADNTRVIRDILEENEVPLKYYLSVKALVGLKRRKEKSLLKGNNFGYEIRGLDDIANTLVCGGMGLERNLIIDKRFTDLTQVIRTGDKLNKDYIRKMTPRERARLQGFPDDFKLPVANCHLYKQLGNTVTVPVIRAIAERIYEVLKRNE